MYPTSTQKVSCFRQHLIEIRPTRTRSGSNDISEMRLDSDSSLIKRFLRLDSSAPDTRGDGRFATKTAARGERVYRGERGEGTLTASLISRRSDRYKCLVLDIADVDDQRKLGNKGWWREVDGSSSTFFPESPPPIREREMPSTCFSKRISSD